MFGPLPHQLPIWWHLHTDSRLDWCCYLDTFYGNFVFMHAMLDLDDFMD